MKIKSIPSWTGVLVGLLCAMSYILSFTGLHDLVLESQLYPAQLAWMWPVVLDGAIISFSLYVVWAIQEGVGKRYALGLVALATISSIAFNVIHAPADHLARVLSAFPPLLGFAAFELMMRMLNHYSTIRRSSAGVIEVTEDEIEEEDKNDVMQEIVNSLNRVERAGILPHRDKLNLRRSGVLDCHKKGMSPEEIAEQLDVTLQVVRRDLTYLTNNGMIDKKSKVGADQFWGGRDVGSHVMVKAD